MHALAGVHAAALTPLHPNLTFDPEGMLTLLDFLAKRGCHGALILGTTGEGTSFSIAERAQIIQTAARIRNTHPNFKLIAGVGTPAIEETITLTKNAFDHGYDAVLALPPYYFRNASENGLFQFFDTLLAQAIPNDGAFFGYHIPAVSGVPLSLDLIARLKDAHPQKFTGLKDSSGDLAYAHALADRFGDEILVLNGNDRHITKVLSLGAGGCITALANLVAPDLRTVWDARQKGKPAAAAQAKLNASRDVSDKFPPAAVTLKYLLSEFHQFPHWAVKPPLVSLSPSRAQRARLAWQARGKIA